MLTRVNGLLLLILLLAAALRLHGLGWELPRVYEEATPFYQAWQMWGWGPGESFDLNPRFFNYPSLTIYLQLVAQAVVIAGMKIAGAVGSSADIRVLYELDPSPFFLAGRAVTMLLSTITVFLVFLLGRRIAGVSAGLAAALFLAVNEFHVLKSQVIEVDVPLAGFSVLALLASLRFFKKPSLPTALWAGALVGLAASTKYTGALLGLPVLVSLILARRALTDDRPGWKLLVPAAAAAMVVFAVTSPFVLLDWGTFWGHLSLERSHMALGHFGLSDTPSGLFYFTSLVRRLGWPLLAFSGVGIALALIRRRPAEIIVSSFLLPYLLVVSTWDMHADRYLLPAYPPLFVFAGSATVIVAGWVVRRTILPKRGEPLLAGLIAVVLLFPGLEHRPEQFERALKSPRTAAAEQIEAKVPWGAMVVTEHMGPELLAARRVTELAPDIKDRVIDGLSGRPLYAVQTMPLFQVHPERSAAFYDLALHEPADFFVKVRSVAGRYRRDADRFAAQCAFYDALDQRWVKWDVFGRPDEAEPEIVIYQNPRQRTLFGKRPRAAALGELRETAEGLSGAEGSFFYELGLNHETFGHLPRALECYERALQYPLPQLGLFVNLALARTRCLWRQGRKAEAVQGLQAAESQAPTGRDRQRLFIARQALEQSAKTAP